jgi:hypothetical protein
VSSEQGDRWFRDADDARAYLGEVGRLWLAWIVTLVLLFLVQQWWALLGIGIAFLVGMAVLGRPLQARALRIPGKAANDRSGPERGKASSRRDAALRQLMYGEAPLREAIALSRATTLLIWVRRLMIVATVIAFVFVMVGLFSASA